MLISNAAFSLALVALLAVVVSTLPPPPKQQQSVLPSCTNEQPPLNWTPGLREAIYRALVRDAEDNPAQPLVNPRSIYNLPVINQRLIPPQPTFGDIIQVGRGQIYETRHGGYKLIQETCAGLCTLQDALDPYDELLGLWTVERVRHRESATLLRYDFQFNVIVRNPWGFPLVKFNGRFDYSLPGHLYIVRLCVVRERPSNRYGSEVRPSETRTAWSISPPSSGWVHRDVHDKPWRDLAKPTETTPVWTRKPPPPIAAPPYEQDTPQVWIRPTERPSPSSWDENPPKKPFEPTKKPVFHSIWHHNNKPPWIESPDDPSKPPVSQPGLKPTKPTWESVDLTYPSTEHPSLHSIWHHNNKPSWNDESRRPSSGPSQEYGPPPPPLNGEQGKPATGGNNYQLPFRPEINNYNLPFKPDEENRPFPPEETDYRPPSRPAKPIEEYGPPKPVYGPPNSDGIADDYGPPSGGLTPVVQSTTSEKPILQSIWVHRNIDRSFHHPPAKGYPYKNTLVKVSHNGVKHIINFPDFSPEIDNEDIFGPTLPISTTSEPSTKRQTTLPPEEFLNYGTTTTERGQSLSEEVEKFDYEFLNFKPSTTADTTTSNQNSLEFLGKEITLSPTRTGFKSLNTTLPSFILPEITGSTQKRSGPTEKTSTTITTTPTTSSTTFSTTFSTASSTESSTSTTTKVTPSTTKVTTVSSTSSSVPPSVPSTASTSTTVLSTSSATSSSDTTYWTKAYIERVTKPSKNTFSTRLGQSDEDVDNNIIDDTTTPKITSTTIEEKSPTPTLPSDKINEISYATKMTSTTTTPTKNEQKTSTTEVLPISSPIQESTLVVQEAANQVKTTETISTTDVEYVQKTTTESLITEITDNDQLLTTTTSNEIVSKARTTTDESTLNERTTKVLKNQVPPVDDFWLAPSTPRKKYPTRHRPRTTTNRARTSSTLSITTKNNTTTFEDITTVEINDRRKSSTEHINVGVPCTTPTAHRHPSTESTERIQSTIPRRRPHLGRKPVNATLPAFITPGSTPGLTSGSTTGLTSGSTSGSTPGLTTGSTSGSTSGSTPGLTRGSTSGTTTTRRQKPRPRPRPTRPQVTITPKPPTTTIPSTTSPKVEDNFLDPSEFSSAISMSRSGEDYDLFPIDKNAPVTIGSTTTKRIIHPIEGGDKFEFLTADPPPAPSPLAGGRTTRPTFFNQRTRKPTSTTRRRRPKPKLTKNTPQSTKPAPISRYPLPPFLDHEKVTTIKPVSSPAGPHPSLSSVASTRNTLYPTSSSTQALSSSTESEQIITTTNKCKQCIQTRPFRNGTATYLASSQKVKLSKKKTTAGNGNTTRKMKMIPRFSLATSTVRPFNSPTTPRTLNLESTRPELFSSPLESVPSSHRAPLPIINCTYLHTSDDISADVETTTTTTTTRKPFIPRQPRYRQREQRNYDKEQRRVPLDLATDENNRYFLRADDFLRNGGGDFRTTTSSQQNYQPPTVDRHFKREWYKPSKRSTTQRTTQSISTSISISVGKK